MSKCKNCSQNPMNTILKLGGILLGIYLITKITRVDEEVENASSRVEESSSKKINTKILSIKKEQTIEGLNSRQSKILESVREKGIVTPKEIQKLSPSTSSRTLRRDMDLLAQLKYVSQKGSTKSTFYKYIGK